MTPAPDLTPRPGEWAGITVRAGRRRRRRQLLQGLGGASSLAVVAALVAVLLPASTGTATLRPQPPAASATAAPAATATTSSPPTAAPSTTQAGCSTAGTVPSNALTRTIPDVDGDGRPDTGFIAGTGTGPTTVGVRTAAGGVFSTVVASTNTTSNHRGVLFADVSGTGAGPFVALTDDNRESDLLVVVGCSLVPAEGADGQPYVFGLGYAGTGDGVACASIAGTPSLVGFAYVGTKELRTAVNITVTGPTVTAVNGASDTVTTQDPTRVTCGATTTEGLELGG